MKLSNVVAFGERLNVFVIISMVFERREERGEERGGERGERRQAQAQTQTQTQTRTRTQTHGRGQGQGQGKGQGQGQEQGQRQRQKQRLYVRVRELVNKVNRDVSISNSTSPAYSFVESMEPGSRSQAGLIWTSTGGISWKAEKDMIL